MKHSIEFGRSSWAGAQWGNTSLGSSGFSTAARSASSSSFAPNQGILQLLFAEQEQGTDSQHSDQSCFFSGPSV